MTCATAIAEAGFDAQVLYGSYDLPGGRLLDLVATMDALRTDCPWDAKQTHRSLAPHLIEESYEMLEALEAGDAQALRDELGDVLLQVVFHARIASEREDGTRFTIDDVADAIVGKLVRRHPHVFGNVRVAGADEVRANWAAIKAAEREEKHGRPGSALDGIPFGQPALSLAAQLQARAAEAGAPAGLAGPGDARLGPPDPVTPDRVQRYRVPRSLAPMAQASLARGCSRLWRRPAPRGATPNSSYAPPRGGLPTTSKRGSGRTRR